MTHTHSGWLLAATAILSVACSSSGAATGTRPADPAAAAPGRSAAEIEALYRARVDSARSRFTEADVEFMTGMIHHHAQAIEMSQLAPTHAASESIRTLAARIINAQQDEIATMQRWLRDRGQPVPEVHRMDDGRAMVHAPDMQHGGGHDHTMMPGMLTEAELASLRAAHGVAFDRLFLQLMIRHHQGAVTMVQDLFATDGAGQDEDVFRFATDVHVDQRTEVARMERMLDAMPAN
ncbi:MAG: DUF305 domain-containing protein [Longimicrobiales bacterium]